MRAELTDDFVVTATAVGLAVALYPLLTAAGDSVPVTPTFGASFLLVVSVMDVALVYSEAWPASYAPATAVGWTVVAATLTVGVYLGVYWLATAALEELVAAVLANLVAVGGQFGAAAVYRRLR